MQFKQVNRVLTVVAVAVLLSACGKKEEAASGAALPVVTIGHVSPVSGAIAHLGKDNEYGARMAIEELNAAGVTMDGHKVRLELMAEDDAADPKQATAVAQKLVDAKVAGVIGHLNSGTTIPASKIYSDAGIPQISPSATNPKYTRQGYKTAFRVVADDVQLGSTLGKYAVNTLKAQKIAVIDDRTAYGQGVAEEFTKAAQAAGAEIVAKEYTNDKATDFNAILTSIKGKKPDVVFFGGMDAVGGPMLKQMKSLGVNAKFMGGDGVCTSQLPALAGDAIGEEHGVLRRGRRCRGRSQGRPWTTSAPGSRPSSTSTCSCMRPTSTTPPRSWSPPWSRPTRPTRPSTCPCWPPRPTTRA